MSFIIETRFPRVSTIEKLLQNLSIFLVIPISAPPFSRIVFPVFGQLHSFLAAQTTFSHWKKMGFHDFL